MAERRENRSRKLIELRGANGAGKSSTIHSLISISGDKSTFHHDKDKRRDLVALRDIGLVIAGPYHRGVGGGMDCIHSTQEKMDLIRAACELANELGGYDVIFEGIMISTVMSTWRDFYLGMEGFTPMVIHLFAPPSELCRRIYTRNGGKKINESAVESKARTVIRAIEAFDEAGISVRTLNTTLHAGPMSVAETVLDILLED